MAGSGFSLRFSNPQRQVNYGANNYLSQLSDERVMGDGRSTGGGGGAHSDPALLTRHRPNGAAAFCSYVGSMHPNGSRRWGEGLAPRPEQLDDDISEFIQYPHSPVSKQPHKHPAAMTFISGPSSP